MIGIWIHHDRTAGQSGRRAAGEYRKARCGYANVYRGRKGIPTQIDTLCGSCGKRVRFNPVRLTWKKGIGKRGSVRQAQWLYQNHKGGLPALEEIAKGLNEVDESYHDEGFSTASELLKEKTEPPIRAETESDLERRLVAMEKSQKPLVRERAVKIRSELAEPKLSAGQEKARQELNKRFKEYGIPPISKKDWPDHELKQE